MISIDEIKAKIAAANPVTNKHCNGVDTPMSDKERAEWVNAAAASVIESCLMETRARRNALLDASDWTQMSDAPVNAKAWAAYRQALRDLPASITDPTQPITWPERPK